MPTILKVKLTEQEVHEAFLNANPIIGMRRKTWKERSLKEKILFWKSFLIYDPVRAKAIIENTIIDPHWLKHLTDYAKNRKHICPKHNSQSDL